ncbi:hypothetical protein NNJEOMEG_03729 [Fundidesulfovibrio magnetotacticus]|uniref:Inhibitor of vertebrate lysozyme (Ivy) n=1 Tax=Fundidesulfovibrio magnetotacticus TaxID=2730080 RepID=A0A6V8M1Z9_9BACT|nr:hypothetical protein [Fundidesulfovibrio magnetotacticus]GFK95857.1 hypothetical protein NNJEOMEG_03729 [Fundidesulfovibrio magnetotacticus]
MRTFLPALILLLTLTQASATSAEPGKTAGPPPASLAVWEGRYPLGYRGEYGSFFEDKAVKALVANSVDARWLRKVLGWTVNTPFTRSGDVLMATLCKPHDCGDHNAVIFFDMDRGSLQMCVSEFDARLQTVTHTWVGASPRRIEGGACEDTIGCYRRFRDK